MRLISSHTRAGGPSSLAIGVPGFTCLSLNSRCASLALLTALSTYPPGVCIVSRVLRPNSWASSLTFVAPFAVVVDTLSAILLAALVTASNGDAFISSTESSAAVTAAPTAACMVLVIAFIPPSTKGVALSIITSLGLSIL